MLIQKTLRCQRPYAKTYGNPLVYTYRQLYTDATLAWAKDNPAVAQGCLQPPRWETTLCDQAFAFEKGRSLEGYSRWRRWPHSDPNSELNTKALSISSHVLSAPLTLAKFRADHRGLEPVDSWCCIGARAEATIPHEFWKEFLLLSSALSGTPFQTSMDFVGPDIHTKTPNQALSLENGSKMELQWYYKGLFHDLPANASKTWDAFICMNPGFGHPHLKDDWHPTLNNILSRECPLLLTAHSAMDAERDARHLKFYGLEVDYKENPFTSRITYEDPFAKGHIVQPNHYFAVVHT